MSNSTYIYDKDNDYLKRDHNEMYASKGTKGRTREKQTTDNVLHFAIQSINSEVLPTEVDNVELEKFKSLPHNDKLNVLMHILRIQAYAIRKAIENNTSIALPYLGRFVYNKYRELSFSIFHTLKNIDNVETIKNIIRTTITDLKRTKERKNRKDRLSIRKDSPTINLEDSSSPYNIINERHSGIRE
jgi:hypothetical protein